MLYIDSNLNPVPGQILSVCAGEEFYAFKLLRLDLADCKTRKLPHREHIHDVYHVALFRHGKGEFLLNGRLTPCRPNTLVLTSPGQSHDFGPETDGELIFAVITFSMLNRQGKCLTLPFSSMLSLQFGQPLKESAMPIDLPAWKGKQLFGLLESCYHRLTRRNESGEAQIAIAFLKIFLFVVETLLSLGVETTQDEPALRLLQIKDFIENNLSRKFDLATLAKLCCLEPSYLCRIFKRHFGCPPIEFVLQRRLEAAKTLLVISGSACKEIAELTGFQDPVYFSRVFKKRYGITPLEYRRMAHSN